MKKIFGFCIACVLGGIAASAGATSIGLYSTMLDGSGHLSRVVTPAWNGGSVAIWRPDVLEQRAVALPTDSGGLNSDDPGGLDAVVIDVFNSPDFGAPMQVGHQANSPTDSLPVVATILGDLDNAIDLVKLPDFSSPMLVGDHQMANTPTGAAPDAAAGSSHIIVSEPGLLLLIGLGLVTAGVARRRY